MTGAPSRPLLRIALAVALAAGMAVAAAQSAPAPLSPPHASPVGAKDAATPSPRAHATGDAWLDGRLADIDAYARQYPEAFAAELDRYAGVPRAYVHGLLARPGWDGGDVWFACFLARATDATCRSVVRARTHAGLSADWKAVAAESGAQPGSEAYAALRLSLADSYRRWARPLQPDPALSRALQKRANAGP